MLLLSASYAATNMVFWSLSATLIPADLQALGAGIVGSALNIGATALPIALAKAPNDQVALMFLAVAALLSVGITLLLSSLFYFTKRRLSSQESHESCTEFL